MGELDGIRSSPAAEQARLEAPAARAHADELFAEALRALEEGDFTGAQIIGEQAVAAYDQAFALARAARAQRARVAAEHEATGAGEELAQLDAEEQALSADVAALEARLDTLREASALVASGPAAADREAARARATSTLRLQSRLLCVAARMLQSGATTAAPPELGDALQGLADLDAVLAGKPAAAPIDQASRVRAGCLGALSAVRRTTGGAAAAAAGAADALLAELGPLGFGRPRRDERGVAVTLEGVFDRDAPSSKAAPQLTELGRVVARHPEFPVLVVLHQDGAPAERDLATWHTRGERVLQALGAAGGDVEIAGDAAPLVDPHGKHHARNERVEIVWVSPTPL